MDGCSEEDEENDIYVISHMFYIWKEKNKVGAEREKAGV